MKIYIVFVLCVINFVKALSSGEESITDKCCAQVSDTFMTLHSISQCKSLPVPEGIETEDRGACVTAIKTCCEEQFRLKRRCAAGINLSTGQGCRTAKADIERECCEECTFGTWTGESSGIESCGGPTATGLSITSVLTNNAFHQCCLKGAKDEEDRIQTTPTQPTTPVPTTTPLVPTTKAAKKCAADSCQQVCDDQDGVIRCSCKSGYRLQADKKTCKDINECAEALDDLCTAEGTVCHNVEGTFKCVPIRKREVGLTCPPGFKRNIINKVCDDINECQLPRPPCPKYLCVNTIGAYKCGGKLGTPFTETVAGPAEVPASVTDAPRNDICPSGFRAGPDEECLDIDECKESLDDCQPLSQHCINTHGSFFCQDHVSKRCTPGFKVNPATGICEDIDECEESSEVCQRSEVCVNLPGAYDCKSKISTLPKLAKKICQEGTRLRQGGSICDDIDECREGTHLCDQFQNCINTFGGHECRCKNGFELDFASGSCVDVDECSLKLDNCGSGQHCQNILGSFTCTRRALTTSTSTTTLNPTSYEYEYYDSDEETARERNKPEPSPPRPTTSNIRNNVRPATIPSTSTTAKPKPIAAPTSTVPRPTTPTEPQPVKPSTTTTPRPIPSTYRPVPPAIPPPTTNSTSEPTTNSTMPSRSSQDYPYYTLYPVKPNPSVSHPSTSTTTEKPRRRPEYHPSRPDYSRRIDPPRPETAATIPTRPENIPKPTTPEPTPEVPDDKNTNEIGEGNTVDGVFNPDEVHCLDGYVKDNEGNCVDDDECEKGQHACRNLEVCVNRPGGYICECVPGFKKDASGWCIPLPSPSTIKPTPSSTSTTIDNPTPTTSTTEKEVSVPSVPTWKPYKPTRPRYPYTPSCELGYTYDSRRRSCVDVDECATNVATCAETEDCINIPGGFRCDCGPRCRDAERITPPTTPTTIVPKTPATTPTPRPSVSNEGRNVITVGAQYGQRGSYSPRPAYSRLPDVGAVVASCPWGYKLTSDKRCYDIDECARNVSECGPQQRCENFYGGYSCQCPAGHRLVGQNQCEDINECNHGNPCAYNAVCENTYGSYRCVCRDGFRNALSNDKVCVDLDECSETPGVCSQSCSNTWGSYRCYCRKGYRLDDDNRTCVDVNECEEYSSVRSRGKLCGGECINEPGSYRCSCPGGYRLSEDGRSCIDLDECETGDAQCGGNEGAVCQNTRGSYHCHHIDCPSGYRLESKHRCSRIQRSCPVGDWTCLRKPSTFSYNFITFVANIYLPTGSVDLFTMHGPAWRDSVVSFELQLMNAQASPGIKPADLRCFDMRPSSNVCVISLLCSLEGPQVVELELSMSLYQRGMFAGSAVARLVVIVSQYEF